MLFDILALISTLLIIMLLKRFVNIFPSLIGCMIRWKESVHLEANIKNSYDRNILAVAMIIPFCLGVVRYGLYEPEYMANMDEALRIGVTAGVFIAYLLVRRLISLMLKTSRINQKVFSVAEKSAYTFFIILTLLLLLTGSVLSFINIDTIVIKTTMLWVSGGIYVLYIFRKIQIFASGFSIFVAFLYLCALEILPTGLLIASEMIF